MNAPIGYVFSKRHKTASGHHKVELTKSKKEEIAKLLSQNRKRSSQGREKYIDPEFVLSLLTKSQNRKRSSQGRGQARKLALQAAEKGIFEKQTNVFLPHK